ncbi:DUF4328 domain-containing protein [Altererythrobacter sp. CC-YST694]|uniref:DUF4328 domain-containing protein n=1 Tax=Altererythrobacter sp. CC-YST694 TaxID=2755038 RepID=UPI001D017B11|nr:DUF4328 domain-containing protein [Altererythrobacter sp. CC-YST694]MCB5424963.1 DUF4328 domain-containing protein [Altererythrobacter sp. CC-YST694]
MAEMSFAEGLALLERRTKITTIAIWATLATFVAAMVGELLEGFGIITLDGAPPGIPLLAIFTYLAATLVYLISVIPVGMWIYRAHANLELAGAYDLEFSPGWSVGWFFVPFMNLFKPFQAMKELWNASYGTSNAYGRESPATVSTWWACYIGGNILSSVGTRVSAVNSESSITVGALIGAFSSLLLAASAWLLLTIVREVMDGQRNHLQVHEAFA